MGITAERLAGGWRLVSWSIGYESGRPPDHPFGTDAEGLILYGTDGWMSATMHRRVRTPLSHPSARQASLESRAAALAEYLSYGGRWRLEGECVVHDVIFSLNPVLIGTRQVREARLVEGELRLENRESEAGRTRLHRIVWRRAER